MRQRWFDEAGTWDGEVVLFTASLPLASILGRKEVKHALRLRPSPYTGSDGCAPGTCRPSWAVIPLSNDVRLGFLGCQTAKGRPPKVDH